MLVVPKLRNLPQKYESFTYEFKFCRDYIKKGKRTRYIHFNNIFYLGMMSASWCCDSFLFSPLWSTTNWTYISWKGERAHSASAQHTRMPEKSIHLCTLKWVDQTVKEVGELAAADSDGSEGSEGRGWARSEPAPPFWQRRWGEGGKAASGGSAWQQVL